MSSSGNSTVTAGNILRFYGPGRPIDRISKGAVLLILGSPLLGWLFFSLLSWGRLTTEMMLVFLLVIIVDGHQIPTFLFHFEEDHRRYMWKHRLRYYGLPLLLILAFCALYFSWFQAAIAFTVCINGFHVGMQNYGVM